MPLLGLIGYPLSHSFSQLYFREKFAKLQMPDWDYELFPLHDISGFPQLISDHPELLALNVTIPHKQGILQYCDILSEEVEAIGAANLIMIDRNDPGKPALTAYNTDHYGFTQSLLSWYKGKGKALILGNGGSSKAIQYSLQQLKIDFDVAARSLPLNFRNVDIGSYNLIINCTPAGMKKENTPFENETLPLNYEQVTAEQYFYDLVYNPQETAMMKKFTSRGASARNGLEMLHLQADKAWEVIGTGGKK